MRGKIYLAVAVLLLSQLPFVVQSVRADDSENPFGSLHIGSKGAPTIVSNGDTLTMTFSASFNDVGVRTDLICSADVIYTLKKSDTNVTDFWQFSTIDYKNIVANKDSGNVSCAVNGKYFIVTDDAQKNIGVLATTIPSNEIYGIYVDPSTGYAYPADLFTTPPQKHPGSTFNGNDRLIITEPLSIIGIGETTPVSGYGNDGSGGINIGTVQSWFSKSGEFANKPLVITQSNSKDKPPEVDLPANDSVKRPIIIFKLFGFGAVGQNLAPTSNKEWVTFNAFQADGKTVIKNLFLLLNDNEEQKFVFDNTADTSTLIQGQYDDSSQTYADPHISTSDIGTLFSYIENDPADGTDTCGTHNAIGGNSINPTVRITGPVGKVTKDATAHAAVNTTPIPAQNTLKDSSGVSKIYSDDDIFHLSVCANLASDGWLQYWGVSTGNLFNSGSIVDTVVGNCTLQSIFGGQGLDIGAIMGAALTCLYTSVFVPAVNWAASWAAKGAGLSYSLPKQLPLAVNCQPAIQAWGKA